MYLWFCGFNGYVRICQWSCQVRTSKLLFLEDYIMKTFKSKSLLVCVLILFLGNAHVASGIGTVPPQNDGCNNAKQVGDVTDLAFDTARATFDGPGHYMNSPNVWYCYTATCTGCATVSLQGSNFDTKLAIYNGCGCYPALGGLIKSNDDFHGQQSEATFPVTAGNQYLIEVGGFNATSKGQGVINISCDGQTNQPTNDSCAKAKQVGNVTNMPFDTTCATFDGPGHCLTSPNLWYLYTAGGSGNVTVSLLGSAFDTKLAVYKGGTCYPNLGNMLDCNDDFGSHLQSKITFAATAGSQYLIEVGGYNSDAVGQGVISISGQTSPPPPPASKDNCANAQPIGEVRNLNFDTREATFDGPGHCMHSPNIWYCYTALSTASVTVSLLGSSYDTQLGIYKGCECYPSRNDMIECNDDYGSGWLSQVTFDAIAGSQYLIEIGGYQDRTGEGLLTISSEGGTPPPTSKDDCAGAESVGDVTNLAFDTRDATFDGPGLCMTSPNIWYCYTATCTGNATVSLSGSSFDTMLAAYNGCECYPTSDKMIECNDDYGTGFQSQITFAVVAGNQYLIEVGGYGSEKGLGKLSISCEGKPIPPSSNDDCVGKVPVGDVTDLEFDTRDATFDGPGLCMTSPNIWYCYTATCTGDVIVSLSGSSFDTMLAVYDGCECYPTSDEMIECNDDSGTGFQSEITFAAVAGNQYLIEIGGYGSETGQGKLSISCETVVPLNKSDLGDAPDSTNNYGLSMNAYTGIKANFPTVFDDGSGVGPYGPVHINTEVVAYLGKKITRETEADTGTDEDGINNINPSGNSPNHDKGDDGVILPVNMPHCCWATFDYLVKVIDPNTNLWVNVWCDWNRDGDWDDTLTCTRGPAPEWAVQNQFLFNLPAGISQITTPAILSWHPEDGPENIWMRITLSEQPWKGGSNPEAKGNGGSGPQAKYDIGETEDYYFAPEVTCSICQDYNGDGIINMEDLVAFTAEWLEKCP